MPICTRCGTQNADNAERCTKCGIALGHQLRSQAAANRSRNVQYIRIGAWIAVAVVLIVIGPPLYHNATGAYLRYHLKSVTESATKACGGPITEDTPGYERDKINLCLSSNADLAKAQSDYANFTKKSKG